MCFLPGRAATRCPQAGAAAKTCGVKKHLFAARSAGGPGECAITGQLPRPPFSLVPSTARSLFGGTKRECGIGTVGSYGQAALPGWHRRSCGALRHLGPRAACGGWPRNAPAGAAHHPRVTFHRGKVTKARRGPSPEGQEAPGPLSAQKTRQTGPAGGYHGAAMWGKNHYRWSHPPPLCGPPLLP